MAGMNGGGGDPPKIVASQYCFLVDGVEVALEDYVAGLLSGDQGTEEQAAAIKAAIEACIAAGLKPETGAIWLAIKDCIGSKPVVIEEVGEDPAAAAAAAAAGQLPGTLIIHPGNGTAADPDWVWYVNGDGTVTNIESPACCPGKLIEAVAPPAATADDHQAQANTLASGKAAGTNIKIIDEWGCAWGYQVDEGGTACRVDSPDHYNACVDVRLPNITYIVFEGPFSNQDGTAFDERIALTNLGCYEATVDIDVSGHSFFSNINPGDSVFVWSGDLVQFNGANLTSPGQNDTAWAHTNDNTNGRQDIHQSSSHGAERHATLAPGAVGTLRYSHMTRSQSFFEIPSGGSLFTIEGGSASLELNA